ncbi:MAG: VOC family protein [Acidobacteriota bacterium]
MIATSLLGPAAFAQTAGSQLPLRASGIEHMGYTSPDPKKAASFLGRIFDPQIFQEMAPPLRYYCRVGTGYLAFGGSRNGGPGTLDHFCVTVENYRLEDMRAELKALGINLTGQPGYNSVTDPEGLRMQLMETPGGLLPTIIASTRVTQEDAICHPIGIDHVMLAVNDVEKEVQFYQRFLGKPTLTKNPDRVWFTVARTKLGLEKVATPGTTSHVQHLGVRVAGYDQKRITERLKAAGVEILPSTDEKLLRFRDADGFAMELRPGE